MYMYDVILSIIVYNYGRETWHSRAEFELHEQPL